MNIDWTILQWIHTRLQCGFLDFIMPKITMLGNGGAIWLIAAAVLICMKKYRKQGIILLIGLAFGVLIGNVWLKSMIARPRPCWLDNSVQLLIACPADYSFPSGHTLSSTIAAVILSLTKKEFAFAAIPLAVLIAFSRLYLYVHFPGDVLGAVLIGLIIGFSVFYAGKAMFSRLMK